METRDEAVAWLKARGNGAFDWDTYGPGAFAVATASEIVDLDGEETNHILGKMVVVCPAGSRWEVRSVFNEPPTASFTTLSLGTLEQAVRAAANVVSD